jgi:hypothetical protein
MPGETHISGREATYMDGENDKRSANESPLIPKAPSTPRVRAYRERRRLGVRCVKVPVSKIVIEALVRMGYLPEDLQQDVTAIQKAVEVYVSDAPYVP